MAKTLHNSLPVTRDRMMNDMIIQVRKAAANSKHLYSYQDEKSATVSGFVNTPRGCVDVISCKSFEHTDAYTILRTAFSGEEYEAILDGAYTARYLVTLAVRFAEQAASGEVTP